MKLFSEDSPYLDENNDLSFRISIYLCNIVCEHDSRVVALDITDAAHVYEDIHQSITPDVHLNDDTTNEESGDDEKDLMITSLTNHLNSSYDYINKLERNPKKVLYKTIIVPVEKMTQVCLILSHAIILLVTISFRV